MRLLHLNEWTDNKGGVEVYIEQLQSLLSSRGHTGFWLGINRYQGYFEVKEPGGNILYSGPSYKSVEAILNETINRENIDVINVHNIFDPRITDFCLRSRPVVRFVHGPVMVCPGRDKFWRFSEKPCTIRYGLHCFRHIYTEGCSNRHPKRVLAAWNFVSAEVHRFSKLYKKIVVMSDYIEDGLLECGVARERILVNPYFTPAVSALHSDTILAKKRLLFVGRLATSKGPHTLITALAPLLATRDDVHLDMVGDGTLMNELQHMTELAGLRSKVTFHGWQNRQETDALLRSAYIVFFPSIYPEAFGIVGIEAMMRGKPVVGFNVGGVSSWLVDGETGFLIDSGDTRTMREKTAYLLEDSEMYSSMSMKARSNALAYFVPDVHLKKLDDIFKAAVL